MTTIYTLIAYKPGESDWYDRCGDYHEGSESELKIQYFNEIQNTGKWWARSQFEDSDRDHTLLINGFNPNDSFTISNSEANLYESIYEEIENIRIQEYQFLQKIRDEAVAAEKIKQQKKDTERKLNLQKEIETKEREQLAQLINKYGK